MSESVQRDGEVGEVAASECVVGVDDCSTWRERSVETALIFVLFVLFAGQAPPQVNEAHYLTKAKHFWDPAWCSRDLFLASQDAHYVFYGTVGVLTRVFSLPTVAWIARIAAWGCLAWSWRRMSFAVLPRRGWSVASAAVWLMLLEHGHMAGEWVIGGGEAKCFSYALVFLALEAMTRGRWRRVGWLLGGATAFHVLVGGWAFCGAAVAWLACGRLRPAWRELAVPTCGGLALALVGLVPALRLNAGVSAEELVTANWIYVYDRLPHHLVFHRLPLAFIARHVVLACVWGAICAATPCRPAPGRLGQRPLRGFVGCGIALALVGAAIDQSLLNHLDVAAGLLRYYWFRMTDALTPAGLALATGAALAQWGVRRPSAARWVAAAILLAAVVSLGEASLRRGIAARGAVDPTFRLLADTGRLDPRRMTERSDAWREICVWARESTPADALFVTPRHQQTFKWFAERAEVATVKDVPQDARSVIEWQKRRAELAYAMPAIDSEFALEETFLAERAAAWGAEWLIVDTELERRPRSWRRVWPAAGAARGPFEVYRIERPKK